MNRELALKKFALDINSDTFNEMKADFNSVLKNTLKEMEAKNVTQSDITLKLAIEVCPYTTTTSTGQYRDTYQPVLSHKITSKMQIKNEKSGSIGGYEGLELIYDKKSDSYIMACIMRDQVTFFDEEEDE